MCERNGGLGKERNAKEGKRREGKMYQNNVPFIRPEGLGGKCLFNSLEEGECFGGRGLAGYGDGGVGRSGHFFSFVVVVKLVWCQENKKKKRYS